MSSRAFIKPTKAAAAVLGVFFLLRLWLSFKYTLGVDEAHYALYGLRVDLSYFDHPPLLGWIEAAFLNVFGVHDWVVRLPANLCGLISSYLVYQLVWRISKDRGIAFWSLLVVNLSFLPLGLSLMFLPDTLLLPLTLWLVLCISDLMDEASWKNWFWLAFCLGLCGITKYTAVFYVISLLGIAFFEKRWRVWLGPRLPGAVVVALLLVSPVFIWNEQHGWISFAYQTHHVVGQQGYDWKSFLNSWLAQFVAYSPFLMVVFLWGFFRTKKWSQLSRISLWILIPCFLFFSYSGLKNFVLPHWTLIIYILLFAVVLAENPQDKKFLRAVRVSTAITGVLVALILSELLFQWYPFKDYQTAYADVTGWHEVHEALADYKKNHPQASFSIGVSNWTQGSRTVYYLSDLAPVFVLDDHYDQYDLWEESQTPSADFILLHWKNSEFQTPLEKMCQSHEVISTQTFRKPRYVISSVEIVLCRGFAQNLIRHQR